MSFVNLGARNKATFWEYHSAYSFLHTKLPETAFEIPRFFGFGQGITNQHCHDTDVIDRYVNDLFWKELDAGMYTEEFFVRYRNAYETGLPKIQKALEEADNSTLSNAELSALFETCFIHSTTATKPMLQGLFLMYLEERFEERLKSVLSAAECENAVFLQDTKAMLLTMPKASIANREEDALIAFERRYRERHGAPSPEGFIAFWEDEEVRRMLGTLVREFGWFRMEYMHDPYTEADYRKEIEERITSGAEGTVSPVEALAALTERQESFFASRPGTEAFRALVYALQEFAFVLDHTKEILVHEHFYMRPLFVEIGQRLRVSHQDLLYLVPSEIQEYLETGRPVDMNIIEIRKKTRAVLLQDGVITWYTGEGAKALAATLLPEEDETQETPKEIKGIIAYPGVYRGKAVVVSSAQDKDRFKRGDVFVVHDGSAEFNLFLQQAGAIVTNEGGMICHAAIMAREMKTPAIVGTRIATKVIKDGDMIEVDANTGTVRRV